MGKHRSKEERLAEKQAWMREQQRKRQESEICGAALVRQTEPADAAEAKALVRQTRLDCKNAAKAGAVVIERKTEPASQQAVERPAVVGYVFGVPLLPRTRKQVKKACRDHRKTKELPPAPPCRCGNCGRCAHRQRHTEWVRQWRSARNGAVAMPNGEHPS